jgi:hypothetical protein|tara:strand:+ start:384 stop:683 length:300 start_codon:yes stop_codon:yes gene_type:complete
MTNKKAKVKKDKQEQQVENRSKQERQQEVREILTQLKTFELNITYEPIKKLMKLLNTYVNNGERIKVSIPFPEINRTIRGILAINKKEPVYIKLDYEKY